MNLIKVSIFKRIRFHSILILLCFIYFGNPGLCQTKNSILGSSDWDKLSQDEKHRIKHIPEAILGEMSTEQLIEACVNTQYNLFLFAYNSIEDGYARFLYEYNGLQELFNRNDAAAHLINYYKSISTNGYNPNWGSEKIGEYLHKIVVVEVLLSYNTILNQLTNSEVKALLSELLKKNNEKKQNISVHSTFGLEKNAFAVAKLLAEKGNDNGFREKITQKEELRYLLLNAKLKEQKYNDYLVEVAKDFLQKY